MATQNHLDTNFTLSEADLEKCRGKWVAFAADGSRVVANGKTEIEASENAEALGLGPADFILEPIPQEETLIL